ncbi:MAG: HTTM domain-containing protein, partial [Myxococcales bacterium]|nr:HTTM domain-containing protein [Myxococcales bacterium]
MNGAAARWHRYWHGFALERERIVALRVAFFGLLTFDMWGLMLGHAARYGAGDFNAAQLEIIDRLLPIPTPAAVAAGWLLGGFFALRTALGIAPRTSAIGTAICYAGIYFWSQADSYQHHYLLAMLLILMAFVPTRVWAAAPRHDDPPDTPRSPVAHWVLRLIYVQIALMYFWTGVTKADPTWLTGATIDQLTTKLAIRDAIVAFEQARGWDHGTVYHLMAWAVMLGELSAPIFFLSRKLRVIGLFIVPWFHVGVEILNFDIEWFSYYMIALDVILLMPSAGWRAIGEVVRGTRRIWQPLLAPRTVPSTVQMVLALGSGALCGWLASRIE